MRALVLDSQSTDATVTVAAARGASVLVRPFDGFVNARRYALSQVRTPWTFMIDADERPDDTLAHAIITANGNADGYTVSRTTYYCGKPMRMWSNERLLRVFRTDRANVHAEPASGGTSQLHERWTCGGRIEELPGVLEHYSYSDAASYREKFDRYTSMEARGVPPSAVNALKHTAFVPLRFTYALLRRRALFDGPAGWTIAWASASYPAVVQWKALRS